MKNNFEQKLGIICGFAIGLLVISLIFSGLLFFVLSFFYINLNFWLSFLVIGFFLFCIRVKELLKSLKNLNTEQTDNNFLEKDNSQKY